MLLSVLWPLLLLWNSVLSPAPTPLTGHDVLVKMHRKYQGKFNRYFTFDQTAVLYKSPTDSTVQIWHEALAMPGNLVIKFDDFNAGNGAIYAQDSQFVFKENILQNRRRRVHELLVLAFDVYHQPVAHSVAQLQEAGIDLSQAKENKWQGQEVYMVGNPKGSHFIIDKKNLWLLQTVRQTGENKTVVDLKGYQQVQGNWIATDLTFYLNGKRTMHEVYYNMKFPASLPSDLFTVAGFQGARW